jgi:glycosyltransferase involved in cell wall biosynthesis
MKDLKKYPKVLIIYHTCINKEDLYGVSIRGWFADWPKENLAQIYSGGEVGEERFCGVNFKLEEKERRFGNLFFKIKGSAIGQNSFPILPQKNFLQLNKLSFWSLFKNRLSIFLINSGFWELIFKPVLSKGMLKFVKDFNPQIIYCQGYNLTFTWLPLMIQKKFNIPICFQTGDDWPSYLYKDSTFSFAIKPIIHQSIKSLLLNSSVKLANGKLMAEDYRKRYGISFEPLMMCDNLYRFRNAITRKVVNDAVLSIIYSGSLGLGRWNSIIDLCNAAKLLETQGFKIMITVFATLIPSEAVNKLREKDNLQILPGPSHEELPSYLKGADILFLPETFDPVKADEIRLSISTKAHFYMMSEKPILVYASPITGIVEYAKDEEWACVVEEQSLNKLSQAILKLITNNEYRKSLTNKGLEVVEKNHSQDIVRERFLSLLSKC